MANIAVIGAGYEGLVLGACLADFGNVIICVDNNKEKIKSLNEVAIPIFERGRALVDICNVCSRAEVDAKGFSYTGVGV